MADPERDDGSGGAFDVSWLPIPGPPRPQTCVDCGGVGLRGFIFCGWCGARLHDETRVQVVVEPAPSAPPVRRPALGDYANYRVQPVELEVSERITLVHWPAEGTDRPLSREALARASEPTARLDTDPGTGAGYEAGGVCIVVLGRGPNGAFEEPTDVQMLAVGDELDVVVNELGAVTSFRVERGGLRVDECASARGVARRVDGAARLRDGSAFRIGSTWISYDRVTGREAAGVLGRVCVLAPSGHVITTYDVGELGLVVGRSLSDPTLAIDPHIVARHCRVAAVPGGATLEDLPDSGGTWIAVDQGDFLGLGCIAAFGDTAVRLDPLA